MITELAEAALRLRQLTGDSFASASAEVSVHNFDANKAEVQNVQYLLYSDRAGVIYGQTLAECLRKAGDDQNAQSYRARAEALKRRAAECEARAREMEQP